MKNYFFGINRNAHVSSVSREKNLFINDNKIRFSLNSVSATTPVAPIQPQQRTQPTAPAAENGAGKVTNNGQSIVASESQFFSGSMSLQEKLDSVKRMVGNDAFAKLSPQAFNALASGKDVQLQIQQTAPERRNLFIASFVTALQLAGGMAGAAYSEELGNYMKDRASKDADFVTKYGNNYKMNLFGGAEARETIITANILENSPTIPVEQAKKVDNDIAMQGVKNAKLEAERRDDIVSNPKETPMSIAEDAKFKPKFGVKEQYEKGNVLGSTAGDATATGTQQAFNDLSSVYTNKGAVDKGGIDRKTKDGKAIKDTIASVFVYGKNGENYLSDLKTLEGNGLSQEQNKDILADRQRAVKDYLALGVSAGLITQKQLSDAGNDPKELVKLFKETEQKLKSKYGDSSGTVMDGFLGAHHMMAMRKAISDKIEFNQGGAFAINAIVNASANPNDSKWKGVVDNLTQDQKKAAVEFFAQQNPSKAEELFGKGASTEDKFKALQNNVSSNYSELSSALGAINKSNQDIKSSIVNTANGIYAKDNDVLARNLNSIGANTSDPSIDQKLSKLVSSNDKAQSLKASGGSSFGQQISDLQSFISDLQKGNNGSKTTGVQMSFEGKKGDIATVANQMAQKASSFEGKSKIEGFSLDTFTKGIQDQLKADGITSIGGKKVEELTNEDIVSIGNQIAQDPSSVAIEGGTSEAQEKMKSTFKAVANLDTQVKSNNITADKRIADGKGIFDVKGLSGALKDFQEQVNAINGKNSPTSTTVNTVSDEAEKKVIGGAVEKLKEDLKEQGVTSIKIGNESVSVDSLTSEQINEYANINKKDIKADRTGITDPEKLKEIDKIDENIGLLLNLASSINQNQALFQQRQSELDLGIVQKSNDIGQSAKAIGQANDVASTQLAAVSSTTTSASNNTTTQPSTGASTTPTTASPANESKPAQAPTQFLSEAPGVAPLQDKDIAKKTGLMSNLKELSKALAQLSDMVTLKLLEEADKMLKKAMNDAANDGVFNYGFTGANYGRITTQDSLVQTYQSVSSIGGRKDEQGKTIGGMAGGLMKIKEYEDLRKQEAQNPKFSIDKALDIAKEQTGKSINGDFSELNKLVDKDVKQIKLSDLGSAEKFATDIANKIKFLEKNGGASEAELSMYKKDLTKLNANIVQAKSFNSEGSISQIEKSIMGIKGGSPELDGLVKNIKEAIEEAKKLNSSSSIGDIMERTKKILDQFDEIKKKAESENIKIPAFDQKPVSTETGTKKEG